MNLSDGDILELNELCNAIVDGTINEKQKAELGHWLSTSEEARQFYVRVTGLSASLYSYAAEMQTGAADGAARGAGRIWKWASGFLAIAACIACAVWIIRSKQHDASPLVVAHPQPTTLPATLQGSPENNEEFVAWFSGSKDCQWAPSTAPTAPGGRFRKGQRIELAKGFAEITFDCGAQIVLQGPATLDINSAWSADLKRGTLKASLPPEAMGFSITNPTVEVVDLGTEFTMFTDASGAATDVVVLKGEVSASPRSPADQQPIVLRERESRRFAVSGIQASPQTFEEMSTTVELERFVSAPAFAHWSFDDASGDVFAVDHAGLANDPSTAEVKNIVNADLPAIHVPGKFRSAFRFDGRAYARAAFPGISDNTPHTVSFWVQVPKDAKNSYAMVAWGVNSPQLGSHPIHITWNRMASEGPLGVLRTDYLGGFAMGSTPLRDGNWHHVAVVFIPRDDTTRPIEVKQYVDGRLEGEGKPSQRGSDIFNYPRDNNTQGIVFLGCRLGTDGSPKAERFSGQMDELFIADRALEPPEICRLLTSNQLQP
jgi:hypothetical protein